VDAVARCQEVRIEPDHLNRAVAETEERRLASQVRLEHKLTRSLVFGLLVLAALLLTGYVVHLLLGP